MQNNRVYFMKKLPSHFFKATWGGLFWLNICLPTGQIWADQIFIAYFEFEIKKILGQLYAKKCYGLKIGIVSFGQLAQGHWPNIFLLATNFFARMDEIFFDPNWCKVAEILERLMSAERQSHRVTDSQSPRVTTFPLPVWVSVIFNAHF